MGSVKPTTTLVSNQPLELVSNQPPTKDIKILLQKKLIQNKEYTHLNKYQKINNVQEKDMIEIAEKYKVPLAFVKSKLDDMIIWAESKPNNSKLKGRNWRITLMKFVKEDAIKIVNKNYDPTRQNIDGRNL